MYMNNLLNDVDTRLVAQSLSQKLSIAEYMAAQWEAKATQLDNENKQLKSQLENLKNDNKKEGK